MNAAVTDRRSRKTQAARARIIAAARQVFAAKGVDGAAIIDITEGADVAVGSFYNHFASKDELVEEIAGDVMRRHADLLASRHEDLHNDPAEIAAYGAITLFRMLRDEPIIRWLVYRPEIFVAQFKRYVSPTAWKDINDGVAAGLFTQPAQPSQLESYMAWGLAGTLREFLEHGLEGASARYQARIYLQTLGLSAKRADEIASRVEDLNTNPGRIGKAD